MIGTTHKHKDISSLTNIGTPIKYRNSYCWTRIPLFLGFVLSIFKIDKPIVMIMYLIDLVELKNGYWAAHCPAKKIGSLTTNRAEAISLLMEEIAEDKKTPPLNRKRKVASIFNWEKGGYYQNPKLMKYFGNP